MEALHHGFGEFQSAPRNRNALEASLVFLDIAALEEIGPSQQQIGFLFLLPFFIILKHT
jgi:hypothetical protein